MIGEPYLRQLAQSTLSIAGVVRAALSGDAMGLVLIRDFLEESGMDIQQPFEVGKEYLICTVTLYYVGRVKAAGFGWLVLEDASWVHWTGRLSVLLRCRKFVGTEFTSRRPRTEFCGEVVLSTSAVVSAYGPPWTLPKEPVE